MKYGIIFLLGGILGGYSIYKLMPKPIPQVITKTDVKYKTIKITSQNGQVIETTESESKTDNKPAKKLYGIGLYHDKTLFGEVRLGQLPLFLIGETNLKEHRIGVKLEF